MSSAHIEDIYPLSPMQQGLLFQSLFAPESRVYFLQSSSLLRGDLQPAAFKQAWQQVIARHSALRTIFSWERRETPLQIVLRQIPLPWQERDLRDRSPEEQQRALADYLDADQRRGFNLAKGPLLRLALFRLDEHAYQFVFSTHHIIMDGWCFSLIMQEAIALYDSISRGRPAQLQQPRPYRDYITWLQKQDQAAAEAFWRQNLAGFSAPTRLGIDRAPGAPPSQQPDYGQQELRLSAELTAGLQSLARRQQITLNTVMQGAWSLLLHRLSGEEDVVFGITVAGRPESLPGSERIVGIFINTLPLRIQLPQQERLSDWLQQVQRRQLAARQFEYSSLSQIQSWSDVPPGSGLFESILIFQNFPSQAAWTEDQAITATSAHDVEGTHFPLALVVRPGQELSCVLSYELSRFADDEMRQALDYLRDLLGALVADPEQRLQDLPLLTAAEYQELVVARNQTATPMPDTSYHQLVLEQARKTPDAVAVVFGEQSLSYRELVERSTELARYLQAQGVQPGICVGICMERSLEMLVGLLGIMLAGAAFLPFDPSFPSSRMAFMLEDTQAAIILTQERLVERLPQPATLLCLDRDWPLIGGNVDASVPLPSICGADLAYVIYTSGSTGKPKGVPVPHSGLINYLIWTIDAYGPAHGYGAPVQSSIAADAIFPSLFAPLIVGTTVLILPEEDALSRLATALQQPTRFSMIKITPTQLEVLNQMLLAADASGWVRTLVVGAEAVRGDVLTYWQQHAPETILLNEYGPTETVVGCSIYQVPPGVSISGAVPIGLPIANTQFYVLDRALRPVPVGVPGELYIGGDGVAWGYLNRPQQTAAAFVPDPFNHPEGTRPGARLYKTGDLVRYLPDHDANIEFLGRLDDQVKIRGYRVELAEVEAALIEHPQVREVAVLARQAGPAHALGAKRLVAYVVAENNEQANNGTTEQREDEEPQEPSESLAAELRRFLQKSLPEYMVPSAFVVLDALPLTPHGKLDRHALPLPDRSDTEAETAFVPARGMLEQQLVNLWEEILGIQPVGVTDNFFALGGNSLLAMRMVAQIQQRVGAEMTLPALFANPTIAEIAALLNDQSYPGVLRHFDELAEQSSPLVALRPSGANRPFFLVAPLGGILPSTVIVGVLDLVHYLDREQPYYGLQLPPMAIDLARQMRAHQTMDDEQLREILRQSPSGDQVVANAASQCISAIRQVQKQGPYLIGGFCSGSIVAFEVARLLRAQGHEIDLLLLIDSEAPLEAGVASFETTEIDDHAGRLAWFACRDLAGEKAGLLKKDVPEVAADLERLPREDRYAYVRDLLAEAAVVPRDTESHEIRRLYQIYRTNLESLNFILHSYSPPAYPGPITLVRVMEGGESNDPTLGWGRLAEGGVSILWTPGDHGTLFLPQHIEVLAKLMTECLDAAQAPQVTSLPS